MMLTVSPIHSDPKVTTKYPLKKGEIGLIKTFIHFVHYHDEIHYPIKDEFDQFHVNLKYTRRFGTLPNLTATAVPPATPTTSSTTSPSPSSTTVQNALSPVDVFK
jgi:hypothetical protein